MPGGEHLKGPINGDFQSIAELREHLYPVRNQVLMTAPVPASAVWPIGGMSIDSERGARELYMIRCA